MESDWELLGRLLGADADAVEVIVAAAGREPDFESLLDGLDDAGAVVFLRADDSGMELVDGLEQLPRVFAADAGLRSVADVDDLQIAVVEADARLKAAGLRVASLPGDGETWPFVVVRELDLGDAIVVGARLGIAVRSFE